ncbi:MAG: hypothetical protein NC123_03235 [Butyrivibrio sp.]|nr:hypothetical protein [Acetatifactor muris]MCM1558555.1 hypothetical protein [Butyrivibrio sp.]
MKKRYLAVILSFIMLLAAGCGTPEGGQYSAAPLQGEPLPGTADAPDTVPDAAEASGTDKDAANAPGTDRDAQDAAREPGDISGAGPGTSKELADAAKAPVSAAAVYEQIVRESTDATAFSLIYLDDDDIPELVAGDRGNDVYSVYTARDGRAVCLINSLSTVEFTYYERKGVIAVFDRWNGGGDEGGYGWTYYHETIADGFMPVLGYTYNAVYDENGVYTGEGVTQYFYMGDEVDMAMYDKTLESWGIAEEISMPCLENAVSAEEMLGWLNVSEGFSDPARSAFRSFLSGNLFFFDTEDIKTWSLNTWVNHYFPVFASGGDPEYVYEYVYMDLDGDGVEELLVQYINSPESYNGVFHYEDGRLYCWQHDTVEMTCRDYPLKDGTMVRQYDTNGTNIYNLFRYQSDGSEVESNSLFARTELWDESSTAPCPYYEVDGTEVSEAVFEELLKDLVTDQRLDASDWTVLVP